MPVVTIQLSVAQAQRIVNALIERRAADPARVPITVKGFLKEKLVELVRVHEKVARERESWQEFQRLMKARPELDLDNV